MSDVFRLKGSWSTDPITGAPSGDPHFDSLLDESTVLTNKEYSTFNLAADSPVSVGLGGLTSAHVVIVKTVGGKVRVRLTSTDGSAQSVPVDSLLVLTSLSVPVTGIDLTRTSGTSTLVRVFLGERA